MRKIKKLKKIDLSAKLTICLLAVCAVLFFVSIRGYIGNPDPKELNTNRWKQDGPFELSPERGRYALIYTIVENRSPHFTPDIGLFAMPDVGIANGKFVSLFAPFLSYIALPGYLIGKYFGAAQIGAFAVIALFALVNLFLIKKIARLLGAHEAAAFLGGLIFAFATPAFAYGVNLYQHHVSTFLLLVSLYAILKLKKSLAFFVTLLLFSFSLPLDYPNLFLFAPIVIYIGLNNINLQKLENNKLKIGTKLINFFIPLIMILPIGLFLLSNYYSYSNPLQISGALPTAEHLLNNSGGTTIEKQLEESQQILLKAERSSTAVSFFKTRDLLNGFYTHFTSPDRGIIYYAPVILFGFIGGFFALKKKIKLTPLFFAIIAVDIILYSMWEDPWGGWAFGSRYLIPAYAILAIFIALLLTHWKKKIVFLILFLAAAIYSIAVNTLGAITTSALPPQVQVLHLEKISGMIQKYTYSRNWDLLIAGQSKSFVYQTYLKNHLSALEFYLILSSSIVIICFVLTAYLFVSSKKKNENI